MMKQDFQSFHANLSALDDQAINPSANVSLEQQTTVELPYEAAMPPELQPVASAEHTRHISAHI